MNLYELQILGHIQATTSEQSLLTDTGDLGRFLGTRNQLCTADFVVLQSLQSIWDARETTWKHVDSVRLECRCINQRSQSLDKVACQNRAHHNHARAEPLRQPAVHLDTQLAVERRMDGAERGHDLLPVSLLFLLRWNLVGKHQHQGPSRR